MRKIKTTLDVLALFLVWGMVMFTAGMMFEGIANYSLKDVLITCGIVFGFGGLNVWFIFVHIVEVNHLMDRQEAENNTTGKEWVNEKS
jgi:hypothetical protein|tara:strand:+ start:223 stop:486 length:264 start_codon:yes stop_codon:yes gene_type:complete